MTPTAEVDSQAVVLRESRDVVRAEDFLPLLTVQQAVARKAQINAFISDVMTEGEDYGQIPGTAQKKVLLKPGAEKLCSIFGLAPTYEAMMVVEDWTGANHAGEPLFYYQYRCQLSRGGRFMGEGIGSANSWESKYRYRWVPENHLGAGIDTKALVSRSSSISEFAFAIDKAETGGQYGKPAEYWERWRTAIQSGEARAVRRKTSKGKELDAYEMGGTEYRVPNPDVADTVNTIQKMAQKRALVAAVLVVTNCSDAFTQDVEDFEQPPATPGPPPAAPVPPPLKSGRAIPEELTVVFANIDRDSKTIPDAFKLLENALCKRGGTAKGVEEYKRITEAFRVSVPKGTETKADLKECLLDLWSALQKLPDTSADEVF